MVTPEKIEGSNVSEFESIFQAENIETDYGDNEGSDEEYREPICSAGSPRESEIVEISEEAEAMASVNKTL